jgi:hypothetical protein
MPVRSLFLSISLLSELPSPVINQMDTSQAHLSSKANVKELTKPDNLSKDELTAVLKYGAQRMWVFRPTFKVRRLKYFTGLTRMTPSRTKNWMRWTLMIF